MKVQLKEDLMYSKLTDLVNINEGTADDNDDRFLRNVIKTFMKYGNIKHYNNDLLLYMTEGTILNLIEPTYSGPDYICNYYGLMLDFFTDGKLEVII